MDGLARADAGKVAVTLVGEHHAVRPQALDAGGYGWRTAVGSFLPVDVYIAIGKHGTAYWRYAYGLVCHAHLFDDFRY
jgi:hypothetical protein